MHAYFRDISIINIALPKLQFLEFTRLYLSTTISFQAFNNDSNILQTITQQTETLEKAVEYVSLNINTP